MALGACFGVKIDNIDNIGWRVVIDLWGTTVQALPLEPIETYRSEHDGVVIRREGENFDAACGPLNLGEVLHAFRVWVEGSPDLAE